jgi:pimeloyl-ACP methyl ester carboxylesterase
MSALADVRERIPLVEKPGQPIEFEHSMTPMFVGEQRKLLVSFHRSYPATRQGRAVLLCNPFGQEALRAHRLYRVLAERLSRSGIDVMRFDYYGTGDSYGEDAEGDLHGWANDILVAHQELLKSSGVSQVAWVGIRLGANLAFNVSNAVGKELRQLVLVDPILDGVAYSRSLRAQHVDRLESVFRKPDRKWKNALESDPHAFSDESAGFGLAANFHEELQGISIKQLSLKESTVSVSVLFDSENSELVAWKAANVSVDWVNVGHGYDWTAHEAVDGTLVPAKLLRDLAKCLGA